MSKYLIKKGEILKIYTDGAARGNPGPAACAFLFVHDTIIIHQDSNFLGMATNNEAEYQAIINALKAAENFYKGHLQIFSDSNLAIQQINKQWKVNYPHLSKLRSKVYQFSKKYEKVEFFYVRRENQFIQKCDKLCNDKLDTIKNS